MDIIFVVDTSDSMTEEIDAVERNIEVNFASIINQSGIDYRVILIDHHGTGSLQLCIEAPLSGNSCTGTNACPIDGARFFHYNTLVSSHDSLFKILDSFGRGDSCGLAPTGWKAWLRADAVKYFVEITDDEPLPTGDPNSATSMTAEVFDPRLLASHRCTSVLRRRATTCFTRTWR